MLTELSTQLKNACALLIIFCLLTGLLYPGIVTLIAQLLFPWQANGSLITHNAHIIGSKWIGQNFSDPHYFWGRPSATQPYPYNAQLSMASNLGPSNPALLTLVENRVVHLQKTAGNQVTLIPVDLVTASASGLDPEISPAAAYYQIPRIAKARQLPDTVLYELVTKHIESRTFSLLGEKRINVLALNLALDNLKDES